MPLTQKQKIGKIGEDIACKSLISREFGVIERNYWKKWGEIDIIAKKNDALHFVEVKTVSHMSSAQSKLDRKDGKRVFDNYRPEDNIHPQKLKRLSRTIQTYLLEKNISEDMEWRFDAVIVFLDQQEKKARVRFIENIIL